MNQKKFFFFKKKTFTGENRVGVTKHFPLRFFCEGDPNRNRSNFREGEGGRGGGGGGGGGGAGGGGGGGEACLGKDSPAAGRRKKYSVYVQDKKKIAIFASAARANLENPPWRKRIFFLIPFDKNPD